MAEQPVSRTETGTPPALCRFFPLKKGLHPGTQGGKVTACPKMTHRRATLLGMRAILVAVLVGATLGLLVAGVLVFVVWDACDLGTYPPALVLRCVGRDAWRLWPWPPGSVHELDTPPAPIGRAADTPCRRGYPMSTAGAPVLSGFVTLKKGRSADTPCKRGHPMQATRHRPSTV